MKYFYEDPWVLRNVKFP